MAEPTAVPAVPAARPDAVAGATTPAVPRKVRRFDPLRGGTRFWIAFLASIVVTEVLVPLIPGFPETSPEVIFDARFWLSDQAAWIIFFVIYLVLMVRLFRRDGPERIRAWVAARAAQPSRRRRLLFFRSRVGLIMVYFAAAVAIYSTAGVLNNAETLAPEAPGALKALSALAVALAWFVVHVVYAERYASLYYREGGGLAFPDTAEPDYWDFVYFSLAIGMTFGTTNVRATTRGFRRVMLPHKLFSFAFNTAILALVLTVLFQ